MEIGANDARFQAALKRAHKQLRAFGAAMQAIGTRMAAVGGAVVAAGVAMAKNFADMGDQVHKMSLRTGLSTEALSELGLAAELSGADLATLENGVRKMQKSIGDAGRGLTTPIDALKKLGLTVEDLNGLSPEKQFELIADGIARIQDPTERAAVAMDLFGRSGTKLLPLLQNGAAGMEAMRARARELGLTISQEDAESAALLTDTLTEMWRVIKQTSFTIGSALAPTLTAAAAAVTRVAVSVMAWMKENKPLVLTIFKIGAVVAAAGAALATFGTAIVAATMVAGGLASALTATFGAISGVIALVGALAAAVFSPLGLVVAAVAIAAAAFIDWRDVVDEALGGIKDTFNDLKEFVGVVLGGIRDALAAGDITLAAKILWNGLKVAWLQGTRALREKWYAFKKDTVMVFHEIMYAIEKTWLDGTYALRTAWIKLTSFLTELWTKFSAGFRSGWESAINWTTKRIIEMMGLLDDSIDVEEAKRMADEESAAKQAEIETEKNRDLGEQESKKEADLRRAKGDYEKKVAEAEADLSKAVDSALSEQDQKIAEAKAALAKAKQELAESMAKAKSEAAAEAANPKVKTGRSGAGTGEEDFNTLMDRVSQKVQGSMSVVGTFSTAALQGIGYSGAGERTAKATEATAKWTKWLADDAKHNRAVFT